MANVMVIAAHPDDEILGLAGTLAKHVDRGDSVTCIILGEGITSRFDERIASNSDAIDKLHQESYAATKVIGIENLHFVNLPDNRFDQVDLLDVVKKIEVYREIYAPTIVYTHHYGDLNIDHKITYQAVMTAFRPINDKGSFELITFETPSATEWDYNPTTQFCPNIFVDISTTLQRKLDAMACYKNELRPYPHPRSLKALEAIAKVWGIKAQVEYAEAFELVRKVVK